jgi:hypothetical protein
MSVAKKALEAGDNPGIIEVLSRIEGRIIGLSSQVDHLKSFQQDTAFWWEYDQLKPKNSGYAGVSILMALGRYGKFDRTIQWIKAAKLSKSTFYHVLKELKMMGLINRWKELTYLGERVHSYVESSSVPVVTKSKFKEIVDQLRAKPIPRRISD